MYYGQQEINTPTDVATGHTTNTLPCAKLNNSIKMLKTLYS